MAKRRRFSRALFNRLNVLKDGKLDFHDVIRNTNASMQIASQNAVDQLATAARQQISNPASPGDSPRYVALFVGGSEGASGG